MQQHLARTGGIAAVVGALTLLVATLLHPMSANPNDPSAAFAEYAADSIWIASHLGQFLGILILGAALAALSLTMDAGRPAAWGRIGALGAAAGVAATAALQAVDGVALKVMVDRWAAATGDAQVRAFEGAFVVRQIEIGLASMVSLLFGLTILVFGVAMLSSRRFPRWLGWVGIAGGVGNVAAGVAQAHTGFSGLAMSVSMTASSVLLVWAVALGVAMWRLAPRLVTAETGAV